MATIQTSTPPPSPHVQDATPPETPHPPSGSSPSLVGVNNSWQFVPGSTTEDVALPVRRFKASSDNAQTSSTAAWIPAPYTLSEHLQLMKFNPETVYKTSFADIDRSAQNMLRILRDQGYHVNGKSVEVFLLSRETQRVRMQKRAGKNTSRPFALEVPGGGVEQGDKSFQLAGLRELLEETGSTILDAQPLRDGHFYFWKHKDRITGEHKWLIKFVFAYVISGRDTWLFNNRVWDSQLRGPKGNLSILFDPQEVSDTFSVTKSQLGEMILWDPQHPKLAEDPKHLIIGPQTRTILDDLFCLLPQLEESPSDANRICYFEKVKDSETLEIQMDGKTISIQDKDLADLIEGVREGHF